MKRLVLGGALVALLAGGGSVLADPPGGPGPNGNNTYGLCDAYGHNGGNNNGRAFQELERAAREADEADGQDDCSTTAEEVGRSAPTTARSPARASRPAADPPARYRWPPAAPPGAFARTLVGVRRAALLLPLVLAASSGACSSGAGPQPRATTAPPVPTATTTTPAATPATTPPSRPTPTVSIATERTDVHFKTPTGNIECYLGETGVACDVHEHTWKLPPPPDDCEFDWAAVPAVEVAGPAVVASCVSDSRSGAKRVLAYGAGVRLGPMECVSERTGLTCRSTRSRHGFTVSRERYRLF